MQCILDSVMHEPVFQHETPSYAQTSLPGRLQLPSTKAAWDSDRRIPWHTRRAGSCAPKRSYFSNAFPKIPLRPSKSLRLYPTIEKRPKGVQVKAVVITGVESIEVAEVEDPTLRDEQDAIVQVERMAICGSDLHPYRGEWGDPTGQRPGHELIGTIVEAGSGVRARRVGERVLMSGAVGCGLCSLCGVGLVSKCTGFSVLGIPMLGDYPGGQSEYVTVPCADSTLWPIPEGVTPEQALLLTDALATGWQGANRGRVREGDSVAIVGFGPIGMCAAMSSRALGAWDVFVLDPLPSRRAFAEELGFQALDPSAAGTPETIRELSSGGVDAAIEAAGRVASLETAIASTHARGTISVVSAPSEPIPAELPDRLLKTQRMVTTTASPQRAWSQLVPRLAEVAFQDADRIFSHRMSLDSAADAYRLFSSRPDHCRKIQLDP